MTSPPPAPPPVWPRIRLLFVLLFLAPLVWLGLKEGLDGWRSAETDGQRIASILQVLYGLASIGCVYALLRRPRWVRPAFTLWAAALSFTGGLAPVVWGGAEWWVGVLSGVATLLLAALICWGAFAHVRLKAAA